MLISHTSNHCPLLWLKPQDDLLLWGFQMQNAEFWIEVLILTSGWKFPTQVRKKIKGRFSKIRRKSSDLFFTILGLMPSFLRPSFKAEAEVSPSYWAKLLLIVLLGCKYKYRNTAPETLDKIFVALLILISNWKSEGQKAEKRTGFLTTKWFVSRRQMPPFVKRALLLHC